MQVRPRFRYVLYRAPVAGSCSFTSYYDALTDHYRRISATLQPPYNQALM